MSQYRGKRTVFVVLFALLAGAAAAMSWAGNLRAEQDAARADLDLFLEASSAGWAEATSQFFRVPEAASQTIGALIGQTESIDERLALMAESIRGRESLNAAYLAYPDGRFEFVARSDEGGPGGFRTRVIDIDERGARTLRLALTDADLNVLEASIDTDDDYEPRERPWFVPIAQGLPQFWTEPYNFASSGEPGITHSTPVLDERGNLFAVVGIDIRLIEVTDFLEELSPRDNGAALVLDDNGILIAQSSHVVGLVESVGLQGEGIVVDQSAELGALIDRLEGGGNISELTRSSDGMRTTVVRYAGVNDEWLLAVQALDADFLDDDTATNAVGVVAVGIAVAGSIAALGLLVLRYLSGLETEAEIDELTGVYNRRAVKRRLQCLLDKGHRPIHVAIIDLDNFKTVNDRYGHAAGDAVLATIGGRLTAFAAETNTSVGRLGGDEFVVLGECKVNDWASLTNSIAQPIEVGELELVITASVGITRADRDDDFEIEELFRDADHLLFEVKRSGGAGHLVAG